MSLSLYETQKQELVAKLSLGAGTISLGVAVGANIVLEGNPPYLAPELTGISNGVVAVAIALLSVPIAMLVSNVLEAKKQKRAPNEIRRETLLRVLSIVIWITSCIAIGTVCGALLE